MADENRVKSYKTVYRGGMGEIVEKKSRFIAHVAHVESEEEALAFVEKIKKEYWDARHNCHAFTVGIPQETARCSDDGEPAQTAGKPMLDVLIGQKMQYLAAKLNLMILDTFYTDGVEMQLLVPDEQFQSFIKEVTEASNGKVAPETEGSCYGADVEGRTEIFDA